MLKHILNIGLVGLTALSFSAYAADASPRDPLAAKPDAGPNPDAIYMIINGVKIPNLYADVVRSDLSRTGREPSAQNVQDLLIQNELLAEQAKKDGLDKSPQVQALLDLQRKDLLGKLVIENFVKTHPVSNASIQAEYDNLKAKMADAKEYHVRHILVGSEAEAANIIKQIKANPSSFAALAKKYSKDTGSAENGGDIGWMAPANLVPEFSQAMVSLKKGELDPTPVKTQYGWHVIQLLDTRKLAFPTLDQVKSRIANKLMQEQLHNFVEDLRTKATISVPGSK